MSFTTAGTPITSRVVFNTGTLDFGSSRLVDIDSINLTVQWNTAPLYVVGSIEAQDLVRHSLAVSLTGKIKSYAPEMDNLIMGVSSAGSPNQIYTLDGQPTLQNPVLTLFDRNNKQIQYQLQGALFKSNKLTASAQAYAEFDFELDAKGIVELYTS